MKYLTGTHPLFGESPPHVKLRLQLHPDPAPVSGPAAAATAGSSHQECWIRGWLHQHHWSVGL